jgi:KDO2-lipid IV(A) lauroyltransferase
MDATLIRLLANPGNWLAALGLGCLWLLNLLPYVVKIRFGKKLGRMLYYVLRRRRHIASTNLKLCFPELSEAEHQRLVHECYENLGAGLMETAMGWWTPESKIHPRVSFEGREHLDAAMAQGKGVILVGAHFSSLDLGPKLINKHYQIHAVYRRQKNQLVNYALERGRSAVGVELIDSQDARQMVRKIRQGNIVWFAPDHDMGAKVSVFAPFFKHEAATVTATGKFARLTGAPAVFCSNHRNADDSGYTVRLTPIDADIASADEVDCATIINEVIAQHIMIDPAQYYWFHRKFKTQPGLPKAALYQVEQQHN